MKMEECNFDVQQRIRKAVAKQDAEFAENLRRRNPLGEGDRDALAVLKADVGTPEAHAIMVKGYAPKKPKRRIRQSSKPLMNKLETEWYHVLKSAYPPECPVFSQAIRFRLGNGIWYKPDFIVFGTGQAYGYEVKGPHAFRGGFENLKVCASLYREIKWYLVWKGDLGQWQEQTILP